MNHRDSPLYWSFPVGTWFATDVRISVFFPLLLLLFCFQLGLLLGLVVAGLLFVSVVLHEFGHVIAARRTGGSGSEILIWPLGGLASVQPAATFASRFLTAAAGPAVNLTLCLITLWHVLNVPPPALAPPVNSVESTASSDDAARRSITRDALNPLVMPAVDLTDDVLSAVLVLLFALNWTLLLVNLIPVYPLDGGRMLQSVLSSRMGHETATDVYIKVGLFFAFVMMLGGLLLDNSFVVFIGAIVLVLNFQESVQLRSGEAYDDSFMGYDFSQGYTSLERSLDDEPAPKQRRPGLVARWREKRRQEQQRREAARDLEDAAQLDALLEKVHTQGIDALTEAERRQLARASQRMRDKGTQNT